MWLRMYCSDVFCAAAGGPKISNPTPLRSGLVGRIQRAGLTFATSGQKAADFPGGHQPWPDRVSRVLMGRVPRRRLVNYAISVQIEQLGQDQGRSD